MSRPLSVWLLSTCAIVLVASCSVPGMSEPAPTPTEPAVVTVTGSETMTGNVETATGTESMSGAVDVSVSVSGAMTPAEIRAERRRQRDEAQRAASASGETGTESGEVDAEPAILPPAVAPSPSVPPSSAAPTTEPSPTASAAKSGTFTVKGDYSTPAGMEKTDFIVAVNADVITSVSIAKISDNGVSARYQNMFLEGAKSQIVGKKLSDVQNIDRVGGSSLTPKGFKAAIKNI